MGLLRQEEILHRIHVPAAFDNGTRISACVQDRRAFTIGEIVTHAEGRDWYVRYGLGVSLDGILAKAGIHVPHVYDGASIIDAAPEDTWSGSLVNRTRQAYKALERPAAGALDDVVFLHPSAPIPLKRGGNRRPFRSIYVDEGAARRDSVANPWYSKGLATAYRLKRVLADELLVDAPASRRRWTCYPSNVLVGSDPYNLLQMFLEQIVRGRAPKGVAARATVPA